MSAGKHIASSSSCTHLLHVLCMRGGVAEHRFAVNPVDDVDAARRAAGTCRSCSCTSGNDNSPWAWYRPCGGQGCRGFRRVCGGCDDSSRAVTAWCCTGCRRRSAATHSLDCICLLQPIVVDQIHADRDVQPHIGRLRVPLAPAAASQTQPRRVTARAQATSMHAITCYVAAAPASHFMPRRAPAAS